MTNITLTTPVKICTLNPPITYHDQILVMGSCFAQRIHQYLQHYLYHVSTSPFGILYNPHSIAQGIIEVLDNENFDPKYLFYEREQWHSHLHHSDYSHHEYEQCLQTIQHDWTKFRSQLQTHQYLVITLGTAWIYRDIDTQWIVNNCHQRASHHFERARLSLSDIIHLLCKLQHVLSTYNPNLKVIYTVSPVRHIKDGLIENQRSKALLLLAIEEAIQSMPQRCFYFPSYEIMLDELRGYRFYQEDLLHPSDQAASIICHRFTEAYLDKKDGHLRKRIYKLRKDLSHKSRNPMSQAHQKHLARVKGQIELLKNQYPHLNFDAFI